MSWTVAWFIRLILPLCALTACGIESRVSENSVTETSATKINGTEIKNTETRDTENEVTEETVMQSETPSVAVTFVYGNDVWQPGWAINDSHNWLALACSKRGCNLEPASLKVAAASGRVRHDNYATSGQKLSFKLRGKSEAKPSLWFKADAKLPWLRIGRVPTYYSAEFSLPKQNNTDTFEINIKNASGDQESLVPVLIAPADRPAAAIRDERQDAYLQLRARDKRQLIDEPIAACSQQLSREYLQWAGDLDGDGKTDYVLNFLDGAAGSIKLYLSSGAANDALVGLAGEGLSAPLDGECYR
jgi:hypothetical protein